MKHRIEAKDYQIDSREYTLAIELDIDDSLESWLEDFEANCNLKINGRKYHENQR